MLGGVVAIVAGCALYGAPKEVELEWYYPLPFFPAGLLLIFFGVKSIRSSGN
jgi:hypothetical protein